jgi:hypothetical protein
LSTRTFPALDLRVVFAVIDDCFQMIKLRVKVPVPKIQGTDFCHSFEMIKL